MVGKVRVRGQGKVMKGRRQTTTTYKRGGKVKKRVRKQVGGVMPGVGAAGMARPLAAGAAQPLAAGAARPVGGAARPVGGGVLPGARTMVKKGGMAARPGGRPPAKRKRRAGRAGPSPGTRKKTKFSSAFVKGDPNTPGEFGREVKGGMTMGHIRSKKVLKGDYDLGKQMRKKRKHHDQT